MGKTCKVTFKYEAKEDDELELQVNDIIVNVESDEEDGWCKGTNQRTGKSGLFPDNFVKFIDDLKPSASEPTKPSKPAPPPSKNKTLLRTADPPTIKPSSSSPSSTLKFKATFDYTAENPDEISLQTGEIIERLAEVEEGWARGRVISSGKEGLYPTNFVEEFTEEVVPKVKKPPIGGVAMLPIQPLISNKPKPSSMKVRQTAPAKRHTPSSPTQCFALAQYKYQSQHGDELSFEKGDRIKIISKDAGDQGWWKGELNGKEGVFPDNFVKEISPTDESNIGKPVQMRNKVEEQIKGKTKERPVTMAGVIPQSTSKPIPTTTVDDSMTQVKRGVKGPGNRRPPNKVLRAAQQQQKDDLFNEDVPVHIEQDSQDESDQPIVPKPSIRRNANAPASGFGVGKIDFGQVKLKPSTGAAPVPKPNNSNNNLLQPKKDEDDPSIPPWKRELMRRKTVKTNETSSSPPPVATAPTKPKPSPFNNQSKVRSPLSSPTGVSPKPATSPSSPPEREPFKTVQQPSPPSKKTVATAGGTPAALSLPAVIQLCQDQGKLIKDLQDKNAILEKRITELEAKIK